MASTPVRWGWLDHSGERTKTTLHFTELAGDGSNYTDFSSPVGKRGLMGTALQAITKLQHTSTILSQTLNTSVESIPADQTAQREIAIRWVYADNVTGKKYRFDTPAPVDVLLQSGTDVIDLAANVAALAFKDAFELNCVSPDGNAVTMISARFVGRRS